MRIAENIQEKLSRKSNNVASLSKKTLIGKGAEEKKEGDIVPLRGDLEKAKQALAKPQEAMGMARKAIAQVKTLHPIAKRGICTSVTHNAGRFLQRSFTHGKASRMKEAEQNRGKSKSDIAYGSAGQPHRPSIWERIQVVEPLHLANSSKPLVKFVNPRKLVMKVDNAKCQKKENNRGLEQKNTSIRVRPRKENNGDDGSRKSLKKNQNKRENLMSRYLEDQKQVLK